MILAKIEENRENFTKSEKKLVDYIQNNSHKVMNYNVMELSEKSEVSAPSIVRFAKKLGYDGFLDMRIALNRLSPKNSNIEKFYSSTIELYRSSLLNTLNFIDEELMKETLERIRNSERIAVLASEDSEETARNFYKNLLKKSKKAVFETDLEVLEMLIKDFSKNDSMVVFTHHGEDFEVLDLLKKSREKEIAVIAVTKAEKNNIGLNSDINLQTDNAEKTLKISQNVIAETILDNLL